MQRHTSDCTAYVCSTTPYHRLPGGGTHSLWSVRLDPCSRRRPRIAPSSLPPAPTSQRPVPNGLPTVFISLPPPGRCCTLHRRSSRPLCRLQRRSAVQPSSHGVLAGHTDSLISVAQSPDGRTRALWSSDGTVLVWRMGTDAQVDSSRPQVLAGNVVDMISVVCW